MPGLIRSVNGTTTLFATASLKSKLAGILSANIELVFNPSRGVSNFFLNVTQNACNLATIKLQSANPAHDLRFCPTKAIRGNPKDSLGIEQTNLKVYFSMTIN